MLPREFRFTLKYKMKTNMCFDNVENSGGICFDATVELDVGDDTDDAIIVKLDIGEDADGSWF